MDQPHSSYPQLTAADSSEGVANVMVRALVEVAAQRGVSPEQLLENKLDSLRGQAEQSFFSREHYQALTGDPALGLHCGLDASSTSFGLISPLIGHSPTLRRALELVVQFQPLLIEGLRVELSECMGVAQLRCVLSSQD